MVGNKATLQEFCTSLLSIITAEYLRLGTLQKKRYFLSSQVWYLSFGEALRGSHIMVCSTMQESISCS